MNFRINKTFSTLLIIFVLSSFVFPLFSSAQGEPRLVPCGTERSPIVTGPDGKQTGGEITNPCGFKDLINMINKVISFILFKLALPIAAIMFAYAGFLLVFSGGASEKRSKAKSIFLNVVIGLVLVAAAWLIIRTILSIVGFDGAWIGF
jgi:hypothetical protein